MVWYVWYDPMNRSRNVDWIASNMMALECRKLNLPGMMLRVIQKLKNRVTYEPKVNLKIKDYGDSSSLSRF